MTEIAVPTTKRWTSFWMGLQVAVVLTWLGLPSVSVTAAEPEEARSLDEQLFESLEDDLFSDLNPANDTTEERGEDTSAARSSNLDLELQRELRGDDVGQPRAQNPLAQIADSMRRVQAKLVAADTTVETQQMQKQIIGRLDELLDMLQQPPQQKGGGSQQNSQPNANTSRASR